MTKKLFILAALSFLASVISLVATTLLFFRTVLPEAAFPIVEFDANTETEVSLTDPEYRYMVYALVDTRESQPPEVAISIFAADGSPIEFEQGKAYADLLGRYYRQVARFSVDQSGTVTITAEADAAEDFAVFRDIGDVLGRHTSRAMPGWIVGFVFLAASIGLLAIAVMKSEKGFESKLYLE